MGLRISVVLVRIRRQFATLPVLGSCYQTLQAKVQLSARLING
jgi:hypothetical protein